MKKLFSLLLVLLPLVTYADFDPDIANQEYTTSMQSFDRQNVGWEWLFFDEAEGETVTYPYKACHYRYSSHPDYIVVSGEGPSAVFDQNGTLIRIVYLLPGVTFFYPENNSEFVSAIREYYEMTNNEDSETQAFSTLIWLQKTYLPKDYCIIKCKRLGSTGVKVELLKEGTEIYHGRSDRYQSILDYIFNGEPSSDSKTGYILAKPKQYSEGAYEGYRYPYTLSNKDIKKLESFINAANAQTCIRTTVYNQDDKEKNKIISFLPTIKKAESINIRPSHLIEVDNYNDVSLFHQNAIIQECSSKLLNMLMVSDYNSNKYHVQEESSETKSLIEERLGLIRKGSARYAESHERANRYIEQLNNDHFDDVRIIDIIRVDDISFNVVYPNNRIMRVSFYPEKYLTYGYKITYIDK